MPKLTLELSDYQFQTLSTLGIDAWYLPTFSTLVNDEAQAEKQHFIEEVIENLTESFSVKTSSSRAVAESEKVSDTSPSQQFATTATDNLSKRNRASTALPKPIHLPHSINAAVPVSNEVDFFNEQKLLADWEALETAVRALTVADTAPLTGQGNRHAEWFFILPPPSYQTVASETLLDSDEWQLLTEAFASINVDPDMCYLTPLIKQPTPYYLDPDEVILSEQLPLLASELALVMPKKIVVCGQVAASVLLNTQALLADLLNSKYHLNYKGQNGVEQAELYCLPEVSFFLALPAEKHLLWSQIKQWY